MFFLTMLEIMLMAFHNVIIHMKSVFNEDQNHYYCNIFLEKSSYQLTKNQL